jgi:outer membrane protein assembly factor BamB
MSVRGEISPMPSTTRRDVLTGLAAAATAGVAGCLGDDGALPDGDWPMPGRTPRNASALPETTLPNAVTEAWSAPVGGYRRGAPVVYEDTVAVAAEETLATFRASDGEGRAERPLREGVSANPAYDAETGTLVVPTYDPSTDGDGGFVRAFDGAEAAERWSVDVGDARPYSVRIADGVAYLRTSTACLAVSTADGVVRWRRDGLSPVVAEEYNAGEDLSASVAPTLGGDTLFVTDANRVRALSRADGEQVWQVPAPDVLSAPAFDGDRLYVSEYAGDTVAYAPDGEEAWRASVSSVASPAVGTETVYAVDGEVVALDEESGEERWRWDLRASTTDATPVATAEGVLAIGNRSAALRDEPGIRGRVRWALPDDVSYFVSPAVGAGRLFAYDPFRSRLVAYESK